MKKREVNSAVSFFINGKKYSVDASSKVEGQTSLVDYIRDVVNLKGTKVMCREGGCGACVISASTIDPATDAEVIKSVNSCLAPVLGCDGWSISTVESLGNKHEGYSVIQNRLVNFHGTQCGFCTPGMIMNMNSLLEANENVEMEDVEKNLDGNICRCTGYRPILEAFKSLAKDAPTELRQKCADIEECTTCPLKNANQNVSGVTARTAAAVTIKLASGEEWVTAKTLESALSTAAQTMNKGDGAFRFVAGNTSTGIFKPCGPYLTYIDIKSIPDLKKTAVDDGKLTLGGGMTLTEVINFLRGASRNPGFEYVKRIATHLERVANVSVRNNGSIAGNLMIKHEHNEFPSDVFVILEAAGATVTIATLNIVKKFLGHSEKVCVESMRPISLTEFLRIDMKLKLIKYIHLPKREGWYYRSFKITRRYQNAHAYVNAAIMVKVDESLTIVDKPRIVYGGISPTFVHASATEACLQNGCLTEENTLKAAIAALEREVTTTGGPLESSQDYRMQLTKALLYKAILELVGDTASDNVRSGAKDIIRKLSSSKQVMDLDQSASALYKNIPKYEGGIQASGEAEYTGDIPYRPDELFGAYVLSTVASADLEELDASEALKTPGVEYFITAKDIPGHNDSMKMTTMPFHHVEVVFVVDKVQYCGQAIGMILAESRELALKAAKLVKVTYKNIQKPIIDIEEAVEKAKAQGTFDYQNIGKHTTQPSDDITVKHTLKGTFRCGSQYHFHMETHAVICHPREDGIDVHCNTQNMDQCQNAIAAVLNIPSNCVNVQVRRIGGGFGGKYTRSAIVTSACAVAAWVSRRPVRLILDLDTNMALLGKRQPTIIPYEVGFDEYGRIGSLKINLICDTGFAANEPLSMIGAMHLQNVYKAVGWEATPSFVTTDTPSNTFCRAPGSIKSVAVTEWIFEHIADSLKMDSLSVRLANMLEKGDPLLFSFGPPMTYERENMIPEMIANMKTVSDYDARQSAIEKFNSENRWKKRGMGVVPVRYGIELSYFTTFPVHIAIFHMDGHIAVSHGATEMGQGLNTKLIQTIAQMLDVPINLIKVKPTNNFIGANATPTGASVSSEMICYSAVRVCEEIRENLKPILEKLENPTWEKLIQEAFTAKVKLSASYTPTGKDELKGYDVWIVNCTEVEIDVLTGEYKITRTDLFEDTGKSLSPGIDLGQIEGAYIFGQGYWTTEKIVHDKDTGQLLTNGTWDYKVPECKDIPEDFRVTLLSSTPNENGVLRSKATGEPSTDSAFALILAMRKAIASARKDGGNTDWFEMSGPVTPEDIARLCLTKDSLMTL